MYRFYIYCFFAILLLCAGCEQELIHSANEDGEVTFSAETTDYITVTPTRATDNKWATTDTVGIAMSTDRSDFGYKKYKPQVATNTAALKAHSNDEPLIYPNDNSTVTFTAFSPYKLPQNGIVTYDLNDQTTQAKMEACDLIYASGTKGFKSAPATKLTFNHQFAYIEIEINSSTELPDVRNSYLVFDGVPDIVYFDVNTGTTYPDGNSSIDLYRSSNTATKAIFKGIMVPHSGADYTGRVIYFGTHYYTFPDTQNFVAGGSYKFSFTVANGGLALTGATNGSMTGTTQTLWKNGKFISACIDDIAHGGGSWTTPRTITIKHSEQTVAPTVKCYNGTTLQDSCAVGTMMRNWTSSTSNGTTTFSYTLLENQSSYSSSAWSRTIHFTQNGMTIPINVSQGVIPVHTKLSGSSNSFIIHNSGAYAIPLDMAITYGGASSTSTFTPVCVWSTNEEQAKAGKSIIYTKNNKPHLLINITATNEVNSLWGVKVGSGYKWTYHTWKLPESDLMPAYHSNASWTMPRTDFGGINQIYYQSGRRHPFPRPGMTTYGDDKVIQTNATKLSKTDNDVAYVWKTSGPWESYPEDKWGSTKTSPCPDGWYIDENAYNRADYNTGWEPYSPYIYSGIGSESRYSRWGSRYWISKEYAETFVWNRWYTWSARGKYNRADVEKGATGSAWVSWNTGLTAGEGEGFTLRCYKKR